MKTMFQTLPNGLKLGVAKNRHLNTVVVLVGVRVGSRHEPKGLYGAAHFVEHMLFKGTKRRPSSKALSDLIEATGGDHNAFTDKDWTSFQIQMVKNDGMVAVDVAHDMIAHPLFRTADVETERAIVRDEIESSEDEVEALSEGIAYAGTGLAHTILGTVEDVGFSAAALRKFFRRHYVPSRMVVVLAGAVEERVVVEAARLFGSLPSVTGSDMGHQDDVVLAEPAKSRIAFKATSGERLDVMMRFPGVPQGHPHSLPLELLTLALGGLTSGRLFQSLREQLGICYDVSASMSGYRGTGSVVITTEVAPSRFDAAMRAIWDVVAPVRKFGLTTEELDVVKAYTRASVLMNQDKPMRVAEDAAKAMLDGRYRTPAEDVRRINAVTLEDVKMVATQYLDMTKAHVAVVGPASARRGVERPVAAPWLW